MIWEIWYTVSFSWYHFDKNLNTKTIFFGDFCRFSFSFIVIRTCIFWNSKDIVNETRTLILRHTVFTTKAFLKVAINSWPECDLNPQPLNFRQSNQLRCQTMSSTRTQNQLCTPPLISSFVQCSDFISTIAFVSRHICQNCELNRIEMLIHS